MRIGKHTVTLAASGALLAATMGFAAASPAQAASCDIPPAGSMCVHIHNTDADSWYWLGPWSACTIHNIPGYDQVTWINNNQVGGVRTTFYYEPDGTNAIGSVAQDYSGRPPGYVSSDLSWARSIRVC
ncbi:hypothetical protein OIB37_34985 [Streptomyces sp. NBC_00820]|uniref:hypothetical protein n=1 Tax=Streptomyces sp. NBC_00820 TaxID=2975842 RepID=UPI002ED16982|nr:hypothetical protein OIB37_34985 [Streptomyces sp. NBC_00820]